MILQYKGFKENWCYEEAEQISYANVYVGDVIEQVLEKEYSNGLEQAKAMQNAVDEILKKETGCYSDEIIYHTEGIFKDMKHVCVVMLDDKNKHITRVFYKNTAYLLNNRGQTIQRLS
jgi:hypothetical protein